MRATLAVVCTVVLAIVTLSASRQTIENVARGQARPVQNEQMVLDGPLDGAQPGTLRLTLKWDGSVKTSGHWRLALQTEQPDGSFVETGALTGVAADGSVVLGPGGLVTGIDNLTLTVIEGSGEYSAVSSGSGRVDVRLGRENEPFTATISVTF